MENRPEILRFSDNGRINKLSAYLSNTLSREAMSDEDLRMLEQYQKVYTGLKKGKTSRYQIAEKAARDLDIELRQAINLVNGALVLFGMLEYPGLDANQVFMIRKYQHLYEQALKKGNNCENERAGVEYFKQAERALHRINMLTGAYKHREHGVDYSKWQWPTIVETNDTRVLKLAAALIERAEILQYEEAETKTED